jgi:hypothetical protein
VEPLHGDREDGRCTVTGKTVIEYRCTPPLTHRGCISSLLLGRYQWRAAAVPLHRPLHQLPESRVVPQRIERRIDPEPAGRQEIRHLEQRLELVEGLFGLRNQDVDPDELMLEVRQMPVVYE